MQGVPCAQIIRVHSGHAGFLAANDLGAGWKGTVRGHQQQFLCTTRECGASWGGDPRNAPIPAKEVCTIFLALAKGSLVHKVLVQGCTAPHPGAVADWKGRTGILPRCTRGGGIADGALMGRCTMSIGCTNLKGARSWLPSKLCTRILAQGRLRAVRRGGAQISLHQGGESQVHHNSYPRVHQVFLLRVCRCLCRCHRVHQFH